MKKIISLLLIITLSIIYFKENTNKNKFSVMVLPDTQKYSKAYPYIFCNQTDWVVKNKEKLNIVFMSQLGDIVDSGAKDLKEWETASRCIGRLDGQIAYGLIPGNHDTDISSNKESGFKTYSKYFPVSRYNKNPWYKGNFKDNQNNYQVINIFNKKILFLNLEIEPSDDVINWADKIIGENTDAYTILTTHKYLHDYDNKLSQGHEYSKEGNSGQGIWDKLIYNNCSIKMVWSGHYHKEDGENMIITKNSCGQDIPQIVQDYQSRENGGNGLLRIYEFDLNKNNIKVKTYSTLMDKYETDEDSEFILKFTN